MKAVTLTIVIQCLLLGSLYCFEHTVTPSCSPVDELCEFTLSLEFNWTMMHWPPTGEMSPIIVDDDGNFMARRLECHTCVDDLDSERKYMIASIVREIPLKHIAGAAGSFYSYSLWYNQL